MQAMRFVNPAMHRRSLSVWCGVLLSLTLTALWAPVSQCRLVLEVTHADLNATHGTSYALRVEFAEARTEKKSKTKAPVTRHELGVSTHAEAPQLVSVLGASQQAPLAMVSAWVEKMELAAQHERGPPAGFLYTPPDPIFSCLQAVPVTRGPPA